MTIKVGVRLGAVVVTALLLSSVMMVGQMLFVHPSSQQLTGPITNAFLSPVTSSSSSYSSLPISGGVPSLAAFGLAASSILAVLGRMRKVGATSRRAAAAAATSSPPRKVSRDVSQPGDDYDAPKELDDASVDVVMNGPTPTLDKVQSPEDIRKMSLPQLKDLCNDTRRFLVRSVSQTGGHLGSNLGVVELTAALHHVFDLPKDKLIWDVSHQAYPHKIFTGRRERMSTLRQGGGLSGFTKRSESPYDPFGAGHSGTAMSAATGFAIARDHKKRVHDEAVREGGHTTPPLSPEDDYTVVSVVGDGAITGGMAYEAMNHAGWLKLRKFLVILNDNGQVSLPTAYNEVHTPVGALSEALSKMGGMDSSVPDAISKVLSSPSFQDARNTLKLAVKALCPPQLAESLGRIEEYGRGLLSTYSRGTMFEELGFYYVGPVDGHCLDTLVTVLSNLKQSMDEGKITKPILLHVKTEKGHGYKPAEVALDKLHGVTQFDVKTETKAPKKMAYTDVFAKALIAAAERDSRIVAITAAMPGGTGLHHFEKKFGLDRMFDVGICEQHAVTMAAGMAAEGLVPYAAIYSSFMQRAIDQMVHDVALQKLPVRFVLDRAGFVGADGPTHHGQFDLAMLGCIPGVKICAPGDEVLVEEEGVLQISIFMEFHPFYVKWRKTR
ncbi:transketolase, putative [Perkinsus marinus ATCC 50983]|uniref:Transketolase, putative n=1 Tax=Perkinsus marinus (strain ATCC 50983 / TXsc) TaxID=423536 RepID=C5LZ97_PERM5|nr:transketolase, putative [Perkinsus marinus ATCC 50983]EEQ97891.1 transketolase, putative [Perkinsus marinus ATCC 50983]|eukprot:XP_002765174.1 transketolase, putative [Perkinsus marinus ATCC 50983]